MSEITRDPLFVLVYIALILKGFIILGAWFFKDKNSFFEAIAEFYLAIIPYIFSWFQNQIKPKTIFFVYAFICLFIGFGGLIKGYVSGYWR